MSSLCRGEGFLFSVPAVFLLFNLNTQTSTQLHPGKGGGGCRRSWAPWDALGISSPSSLLRRSFLMQPAPRDTFLRESVGRHGSLVLLAWA